ncbi:uncharacterized protein LOC124457987 [Xenia sp. Carnegie-2017]|uniref:uncharacterized protein LOC124457987 n=1 Tax=Xenia sp. Carnegie-2017 TaxID=2897299 RepID=UPI001F042F76|nr:uncharacterized protein LOC124457987 [Xenia sp. Carnegie-2017]
MAQSTNRSHFFVSIGSAMLFFTTSTLICGFIRKETAWNNFGIQAIAYSLYMIAPGVLCVISGFMKRSALLGATLALNVIAVIASSLCLYVSAKEWKSMDNCYDGYYQGYCKQVASQGQHFAVGIITISSTLMAIMSLIGSIYGCVRMCPCCYTNQTYAHIQDDFSEPLQVFQVETGQQVPGPPPYVEPSTSRI